MRALVRTLGVVLTLGFALGGLPAESWAAQATLGCSAMVQAGQQFTTEVTIDVGTTPLGGYSIVVTYDPVVLTLASVAGGSTAEFSGRPTTTTTTSSSTTTTATQPPTTSTTAPTSTTVTSTTTTSTSTTTPPTTSTSSTSTSTSSSTSTSTSSTTTTSPTTTSTTTTTQPP